MSVVRISGEPDDRVQGPQLVAERGQKPLGVSLASSVFFFCFPIVFLTVIVHQPRGSSHQLIGDDRNFSSSDTGDLGREDQALVRLIMG